VSACEYHVVGVPTPRLMELQGNATVGRQSDQHVGHLDRQGTPTVLKEERTELTAPGTKRWWCDWLKEELGLATAFGDNTLRCRRFSAHFFPLKRPFGRLARGWAEL